MTEIERWVNKTCERIVARGPVRRYKDLYKDLRRHLPCGEACLLIEAGLRLTRRAPSGRPPQKADPDRAPRARAIAALMRLKRWAEWFVTEAELRARDGR